MNSLYLLKKSKYANKSKEMIRIATTALREAALNSDGNFSNKLRLLEGEQQSLTQHHCQAMVLFEASVTSAKKSGFIHEEGLAYERAGFYCKRTMNHEKAWDYFNQARECYEKWGSKVKVDLVEKELDEIKGINKPTSQGGESRR